MLVLDLIKTVAAVAVPVVVAVLGYRLNHRLKDWEATQWRNQELIRARLQYYGQLAPQLNDLMCYLTFIGRWKELTPPDVIGIKRDADRLFLSVAPLFSQRAVDAYREFIRTCFGEHAGWGRDARIRSVFVRRREAQPDSWDPAWEDLFTYQENAEITEVDLLEIQGSYNRVLGALAEDIELATPRDRYITTRPSAPAR
jgi:hypothetical protein